MVNSSEKKLVRWTAVLAISTILLVLITALTVYHAFEQLHELSTTSNAEFVLKFRQNFYGADTRTLEMLLDENLLIFDTTLPISNFRIDKQKIDSLKLDKAKFQALKDLFKKENIDNIENYVVDAYYMDAELLNHFEEMGYFEKQGIISIDYIYEIFDWDIETCWENPEIKKFIASEKYEFKDSQDEVYINFEYLYNKLREYDKSRLMKNQQIKETKKTNNMSLQEILILIFTGVIAISTAFYTYYSNKLWRETNTNTLMSKFALMMNYVELLEKKTKETTNESEKQFMNEFKALFTKFALKGLFEQMDTKKSPEFNEFREQIISLFKKHKISPEEMSFFNDIFPT